MQATSHHLVLFVPADMPQKSLLKSYLPFQKNILHAIYRITPLVPRQLLHFVVLSLRRRYLITNCKVFLEKKQAMLQIFPFWYVITTIIPNHHRHRRHHHHHHRLPATFFFVVIHEKIRCHMHYYLTTFLSKKYKYIIQYPKHLLHGLLLHQIGWCSLVHWECVQHWNHFEDNVNQYTITHHTHHNQMQLIGLWFFLNMLLLDRQLLYVCHLNVVYQSMLYLQNQIVLNCPLAYLYGKENTVKNKQEQAVLYHPKAHGHKSWYLYVMFSHFPSLRKVGCGYFKHHPKNQSQKHHLPPPRRLRRHPSHPKLNYYITTITTLCLFLLCLFSHHTVDAVAAPLAPTSDPRFLSQSMFDQASAWNDFGNQQLQVGNTNQAMAAYEQATQLLPASIDIRKNMIVLWLTSNADSAKVLEYVSINNLLKAEELSTTPTIPTIASLVGVALYNLNRLQDSIVLFEHVVHNLTPNDYVTWSNLGDTYLHSYNIESAVHAYEKALYITNDTKYKIHLYRASSWGCDWSNWNDLEAYTISMWEKNEPDKHNMKTTTTTTYGDFVDIAPKHLTRINQRHANRIAVQHGSKLTSWSSSSSDVSVPTQLRQVNSGQSTHQVKPLRIGFVSSDFGVHPVSSLIRGLLQEYSPTFNNRQQLDVVAYIYVLTNEDSWWRTNITNMYTTFTQSKSNSNANTNANTNANVNSYIRSMYGTSHQERVNVIRKDNLDVLIDLNGWTMHSGLEILTERVAMVHVTFLGYSMTTGASFVDFYIADQTTTKIEKVKESFTEKLLLTRSSFFANDYVGLQSHVIWKEQQEEIEKKLETITTTKMLSRKMLNSILLPIRDYGSNNNNSNNNNNNNNDKDITFLRSFLNNENNPSPLIYACFSDFRKIDPIVYNSWMNILQSKPNSLLWMIKHHALDSAVFKLKAEAAAAGISPWRIIATSKEPWIHHIYTKRIADVVLDTRRSNGHTSNADALWGGVPVLTMQGERMGTRVTSSLLNGLSQNGKNGKNTKNGKNAKNGILNTLTTHSMKSYEQIAARVVQGKYFHTSSKKLHGGRIHSGGRLLSNVRTVLRQKRIEQNSLFDTKSYSKMFLNRMKCAVDIKTVSPLKAMHILPGPMCTEKSRCKSNERKQMQENDGKVTLEYDMPVDPFTKDFYVPSVDLVESFETMKKEETRTATSAIATVPITNMRQVSLVLLRVGNKKTNTFIKNASIVLQGWTSITANQLSDQLNDTITAVYLTALVEDATENITNEKSPIERLALLVQESWRVLLHGGALFVSIPDDGRYDAVQVRALLSNQSGQSKFCTVKPMSIFGTFDIHAKTDVLSVDGRKLQRWTGICCGKKGVKINVGIQ